MQNKKHLEMIIMGDMMSTETSNIGRFWLVTIHGAYQKTARHPAGSRNFVIFIESLDSP